MNASHRLLSIVLAALLTVSMLGAIDHLAGSEPASPQWAQGAAAGPRA